MVKDSSYRGINGENILGFFFSFQKKCSLTLCLKLLRVLDNFRFIDNLFQTLLFQTFITKAHFSGPMLQLLKRISCIYLNLTRLLIVWLPNAEIKEIHNFGMPNAQCLFQTNVFIMILITRIRFMPLCHSWAFPDISVNP